MNMAERALDGKGQAWHFPRSESKAMGTGSAFPSAPICVNYLDFQVTTLV